MSNPISIQIRRLLHGAGLPIPSRATHGSAGMDIVSAVDITIDPGKRGLVPTGFAVAVPHGYELQLRPRSGLALKHGVTLPNSPATIDSDYRGELQVIMVNHGHEPFAIHRGDRIAQLLVQKVEPVQFVEVNELPETDRGDGGFGSTGR